MASRAWFITGINSGFGRELTTQILAAGEKVAGTIRKEGSIDDLKAAYPNTLAVFQLDVTDTAAVRTVFDGAVDAFGAIDVVVNNAGYGLFGAAEELSDAQIRGIVDTNLIGSIQVVRAALPHLRARGAGRVIQISTYGGQATNPGASLYNATKWGIEGFIESVSQEVAGFGIETTIVEPGGARTEFRFSSLAQATPMTEYDGTPAAFARGIGDRSHPSLGDPEKMAMRIIESAKQSPAPSRLVLGSDSQRFMQKAIAERLAVIEAQLETAALTDWIDD